MRALIRLLQRLSKVFGRKSVLLFEYPFILRRGWYEATIQGATSTTLIKVSSTEHEDYKVPLGQPVTGQKKRKFWVEGTSQIQLLGAGTIEDITSLSGFAVRLLSFGRYWLIKENRTPMSNRVLLLRFLISSPRTVNQTLNTIALSELDLFQRPKKLLSNYNRRLFPKRLPHVLNILFSDLHNKEVWEKADYVVLSEEKVNLHAATACCFDFYLQRYAESWPDYVYTDHIDTQGNVFAKPDLNLPFLYCYDYIGPALFCSVSMLLTRNVVELVSNQSVFDSLRLNALSNPNSVLHIPELLVCSDLPAASALNNALPWANVQQHKTESGIVCLRSQLLQHSPLVTIIIPSRDNRRFLEQCINSIIQTTDYPNIEIVVVDNQSEQIDTLDYLESIRDLGIRVLRYPYPFNYSAINNYAVNQSKGEFIALLNDDVEVVTSSWLTDMMGWASNPEIGAVGAKLKYPDGRIQHAGLTIGMGHAAGHTHRFEDGQSNGYLNRLVCTQRVKAVTAACLVVSKNKYLRVRGLNETEFKVAYNDVDFCLKLDADGYTNIFCAEAILIHHESISRGSDLAPEKKQRYSEELHHLQRKWNTVGFNDPYFSPLLATHSESVNAPVTSIEAFRE